MVSVAVFTALACARRRRHAASIASNRRLLHVDDDQNDLRHHGLPREVFFSSHPITEDTIPGSTRRFRTSPQCEAPSILT